MFVCLFFSRFFFSLQGPSESPGLPEQAVPRSAARRVGERRRGRGPACVSQQEARTPVPAGKAGDNLNECLLPRVVCTDPVGKKRQKKGVQNNNRTTLAPLYKDRTLLQITIIISIIMAFFCSSAGRSRSPRNRLALFLSHVR